MPIRRLPEYMINRLKAGEIVERPASVLKELVENSLDAWATYIKMWINDGWKALISIEDNGSGIELSDMDLLLERYATSKISGEQDLYNLHSYGFRGEALASIAEVSKVSVISKTEYAEIATKLTKLDQHITMKHQPVGFAHGTIVQIQDLFYNVPARLKFLKSTQTEYFYCYDYFADIALYHTDKHFSLLKNDKVVFDLPPVDGLIERVNQIWRKDRSKHLHPIEYADDQFRLTGLVSHSTLTFGSPEMIKIYVNGRPVYDKVIKKALLDAYTRQITAGEYPFAVLFLEVAPGLVDVNVHPKKLEVKFIDSKQIFQLIYSCVKEALGEQKIAFADHGEVPSQVSPSSSFSSYQSREFDTRGSSFFDEQDLSSAPIASPFFTPQDIFVGHQDTLGDYRLIGQLWNSYIVLSTEHALFYVDQHALAERIAFEKMKKSAAHLQSEVLLQPLLFDISVRPDIEEKLEQICALWFDVSLLSETKLIVHAVPQIFSMYKVDIDVLFTYIFPLEKITFDHVLDAIFASKACKTSIKAWDALSHEQMFALIKDGFNEIDWMFVCQHGRPFFVQIEKGNIDKFFDR